MTTPPDTHTPLVIAPQNQPPQTDHLGVLKDLIGTWSSPRGAAATGFNVMPLPQKRSKSAPAGYILKDFPYYEELTFAPIAGNAPNRGGSFTQQANVIFYEQRVFFATNPAPPSTASVKDTLVHAENGCLMHLDTTKQVEGPFGPGYVDDTPPPPQDWRTAYVKQVSVPHGNSILSVGYVAGITAQTRIVYPRANPSMLPFSAGGVRQPVTFLEAQLAALTRANGPVVGGWVMTLSTRAPGGAVDNILFEQRHAQVTAFDNSFFLLRFQSGHEVLQYAQTISMALAINGPELPLVPFLHVDANTLTRVS